jgi:hypothetical protein
MHYDLEALVHGVSFHELYTLNYVFLICGSYNSIVSLIDMLLFFFNVSLTIYKSRYQSLSLSTNMMEPRDHVVTQPIRKDTNSRKAK